jgi:hypothetical protein
VTPWPDLTRPQQLNDRSAAGWFARIAFDLLNRTIWVIGGLAHRIAEVEFYFRGADHDDPFTHGHAMQVHAGLWYFHRTAGAYRGGSFKGVDITFGDGNARGGILIRGAVAEDGQRIDGPSLLVDHLLRLCHQTTVPLLDQAIADRRVWDRSSPMYLVPAQNLGSEVYSSARVGLSLRRAGPGSAKPDYLTRPYRFLTDPRAIAKGKAHLVIALHRAGQSLDDIRETTGVPDRSVAAYVEAYEQGLRQGGFEDYFRKVIGPRDVCRLHGIADRK